MKKQFGLKRLIYAVAGSFLFFASCQLDKIDFTSNDSQNVENEASTDGYFEDVDDIASVAIWSDNSTAGGREMSGARRITTITDIRFSCATVTIEPAADSQPSNPKGTVTIDYGTGCTDAKGNVRKGKIKAIYAGKRYSPGSTRTVTSEGYSINGVIMEGVRNVTNMSGSTDDNPVFKIEVVGGKATWPDGNTATREIRRVREWKRAANPSDDQWVVSQATDSDFAASGTNRNGRIYQVNITKPLVYKRACAISDRVFMAVEGTKELVVDGKKVTIDYGSSTCDKQVTITINGKSKEVTVRGDI